MTLTHAEIEMRLVVLRRERCFPEAYAFLDSLVDATGETQGVVLVQDALTRYSESPLHLLSCLRLTDQALPLLNSNPAWLLRALINGRKMANHANDQVREANYVHRLRALLREHEADLGPWAGRGFTVAGLHYLETADLPEADHWLTRALDFYREHVGPYDEHDRNCQFGVSLYGLCRVYVARGWMCEADKLLRQSEAYLRKGDRLDVWHYLLGLLAAGRKCYQKALTQYRLSRQHLRAWDHELDLMIVEAMADTYAALGDRQQVRDLLQPLIDTMAQEGPVSVLLRLQRRVAAC